jgi:hypothetical protein
MTVLNQSVHGCCRFFVLILYITLVPLVFLLFFGFMLPIMLISDHCSQPRYNGRFRCVTQYMFCYKNRKYIYPGYFLGFIMWVLYIMICIIVSVIITIIFIIPMYVFSIVSLCRMAYWWRKNKRLNT